MRCLVVFCHPVPESFCASVNKTVISALEEASHEVRLLDLYAIGFDPVMSADERRRYNDFTQPNDCPYPDHIALLEWAEAIYFVYPTWWYGMPAMLKGWLDRVWTPGAAFDINKEGGVITSRLTHIRKLAVITMCGAPMWWSYMVGHPGKRTLMRGMRALFAKRCKTLFLAHYLMDVSSAESRVAFLSKVRAKVTAF